MLGHRLELLWYWIVCLGNNKDHFVIVEIAPKQCILEAFVDYEGYSISSKGFLPTVVDIMVIWIKFTHSGPFYFTEVFVHSCISCLITSNLPWFMDLTLQDPMQYYSLQHQTLLPSPDTSTTGRCFSFDLSSSFLLELFLHSYPAVYWAPTNLGSSFFSSTRAVLVKKWQWQSWK